MEKFLASQFLCIAKRFTQILKQFLLSFYQVFVSNLLILVKPLNVINSLAAFLCVMNVGTGDTTKCDHFGPARM